MRAVLAPSASPMAAAAATAAVAGLAGAAPVARPARRRWVASADDFAIHDACSEAILELIAQGRLTAASALVQAPGWPRAAAQLAAVAGRADTAGGHRADLGLHVNLTQAFGASAESVWPLGELILRCRSGLLPRRRVRTSIARQLDAFEREIGRPPDYIDGHQHVHQFAIVREQLLAELDQRYGGQLPWVRSTRPPPAVRARKARTLAYLGERSLRRQLDDAGRAYSDWLVGVYDFRAVPAADDGLYQRLLRSWLEAGPDGTVLMCHPATRAVADDPIATARLMEYRMLGSAQFDAALQRAGIDLVTGSQLFRPASR